MVNTQIVVNSVKCLREELGLSQIDLALKSGMSQSGISAIERGAAVEISLKNARAIARIFSRTVDEIFPDPTLLRLAS
jgi:DNA-binding XRE family transcriptional regulator